MGKLTIDDLYPLEVYSRLRPEFRAQVMEHKAHRQLALGDHVTLSFEDRLTMHYQVQEMLRAERIFEADGIRDELDAYNPLIPDGSNWKATMLIEYPDVDERRRALARLQGVAGRVYVEVEGQGRVHAIADEDLDRETGEKTSAVHFVRFEFDEARRRAIRAGAAVVIGCDHAHYPARVRVDGATRQSLVDDLRP